MATLYKPFFIIYGALHLIAGATLWGLPQLTGTFLFTPLSPAAAALVGFMSMLAGCGFIGAAFVTISFSQRLVLDLALVGNVLNWGVHAYNVFNGYAPTSLLFFATVSILTLIVILILIWRDIPAAATTAEAFEV